MRFYLSKFLLPSSKYTIQREDTSICSSDLVHQKRKNGTHAMIGSGENLTRVPIGGKTLDEKTDELYHKIIQKEEKEKTRSKVLSLFKKR